MTLALQIMMTMTLCAAWFLIGRHTKARNKPKPAPEDLETEEEKRRRERYEADMKGLNEYHE